MFLRVNANKQLTNLQKMVAKNLSNFIVHESEDKYAFEGKFLESFRQFSWPFVGEHWIPHFSIASLLTNKDHPLITKFLSEKMDYNYIVNQISIWEIKSDKHYLLETLNLK